MKNIRLKFIAFFIIGILFNSFSQSKKLWMEAGDKAFKEKDYASAAVLYAKVLDDTSVLHTYVLPYEVQMVNLKLKELVHVKELHVSDIVHKHHKDSAHAVKSNTVANNNIKDTAKHAHIITLKEISKVDYVTFQLAESYHLNADYHNAANIYKRIVDKEVFPDSRYYYAVSLMNIKRYQEALSEFEKYITSDPANDSLNLQAQKREASCYFAMDTANVKREIKVNICDTNTFNKGTANFAAMYFLSPNKIIFTGARKGGVITNPEKQDSRYLCDLYWTEYQDSVWSKPVNFGRPVNSALHEGAAYVTPDEVMLFTRWSDNNRDEAFIYMAKMQDGSFFEAFKLNENVNVAGYKSMQPFVNFDGTKLFYSSNRPGGKGGFDIWMCNIDENGYISAPKNLGAPINGPGDEVTPFFHAVSNTLFFSSNGLPGLGGLDIFKSSFNVDDSVYTLPKNLNAPINSEQDDAYFIMERTQGRGFFSSDRQPCDGGHCYDIYEFQNEPIKFDVSGYVFDAQTNDPIPGALVTIKDVHNDDEPFFVITDDKGYYFSELKPNMEYFMKAQKNKYFGDAASVATKGKTETTHFEQDFFLNKIPAGEIEIEGIEYDYDKATLRPKSKENLDKIVDLMKLNDNLTIDINSHTDCRGSDAYNLRLSQARAQSCVDYLISKGITMSRLHPKGYGETDPIFKEDVIAGMPTKEEQEFAHQKNRRTAFKVVGESKINIINKAN